MHSFFSTVAFTALVLSSLVSAAPAPAVASIDPATKLNPATPKIILGPVRSSKSPAIASLSSAQDAASVPASKVQPIAPQTNITLGYSSINVTDQMTATIRATMKMPSVLLEDIDSIASVDCSATSVAVKFGNKADFEESFADWPASNFILFTNHLGDCDTDNTRGLYVVSSVAFDNATFTVTASSKKSNFDEQTDEMTVEYTKPAEAKREVTTTFFGDFPGNLNLNTDPLKKTLSVSVHEPKLGGSLAVSGHIHFSWLKLKATSFYVDVDLGLSASANVKVAATASYGSEVYSFSPTGITIAAFSIPGILDVGPALAFKMGVEVAASGTVEISADLSATITNGKAHIDFLDSKNTVTSGWDPVYTHAVNVSAAIEAQVNPFVELTAEMAVNFLGGVLDLSSGIRAKPTLINVFSLQAQFNIDNANNVTIPASTDETCVNGIWFSNAFDFIVTAFVTQFYDIEVFRLDVPIYKSGCWTWAPDVINGTAKATA
ncbi:hypothetical protein ONS95_011867 [Cadophora gregata]|uniref:uncharacterized protein n=1 Tax=Cadophora gregata TaxID=51156 RepID=UPI0026DCFC72|nr:uncharacterized protein ONS95_011867 [Cadophora gregata]KAK0117527.1 hypothetical protein ONS95_011867 [Cadophora gregata]KAK0122580.1 hypothetical protein ONS96_009621 [Cadophora gregata f. sp. sojae]